MRTLVNKNVEKAFTSGELILVLTVLTVLSVLVVISLIQSGRIRRQATCMNNQKEIVLCFKIFAGDSAYEYPAQSFRESLSHRSPPNYRPLPWEYWSLASNELGTAKTLICPQDVARRANAVTGFSITVDGLAHPSRRSNSISYFLGMSAHGTRPNALALGDRNLAADDKSAFYSSNGSESTNVSLQSTWRTFPGQPFHGSSGYYALSDGSVQQAGTDRLRAALMLARQSYGTNANRFLFPQ